MGTSLISAGVTNGILGHNIQESRLQAKLLIVIGGNNIFILAGYLSDMGLLVTIVCLLEREVKQPKPESLDVEALWFSIRLRNNSCRYGLFVLLLKPCSFWMRIEFDVRL